MHPLLILLQISIQLLPKVKKKYRCNFIDEFDIDFFFPFKLDYDPEDILEPLNDKNDSGDDNDLDESGARDHYVSVGKSKLRNEQPLLDDPRYAGKRTSRKDIYSEDDEEEEIEEALSGSEVDEEASDDSNDDDQDLLANANSDEEEEEEGESREEESENEVAEEGDDEINTELRRIQEEEKYA